MRFGAGRASPPSPHAAAVGNGGEPVDTYLGNLDRDRDRLEAVTLSQPAPQPADHA